MRKQEMRNIKCQLIIQDGEACECKFYVLRFMHNLTEFILGRQQSSIVEIEWYRTFGNDVKYSHKVEYTQFTSEVLKIIFVFINEFIECL